MNYDKYKIILEYIPNNVEGKIVTKNNKVYNYIKSFIIKNNYKKLLLSLSGGVDSMVLCDILNLIKSEVNDFNFYCCHVNYNNRSESKDERDFLIDWCKYKNIELFVSNINHIQRGKGDRSKYEEETRNLRYIFYKNIIESKFLDGVLLAHHRDDVSENVFNNIMIGSNSITKLAVLKKKNIILDVNVFRPLLDFTKDKIYELSKEYQTPYFLDSTPDWSCRGKMRKKIFPECENCYTKSFMTNLYNIGIQSESLNLIITKNIINPIIKSIIFGRMGFIIPKSEQLKEFIIFDKVISYITNSLKLPGCKRRNIYNFIDKFNSISEIILISGYKSFISDENIIFLNEINLNKINNSKEEEYLTYTVVNSYSNIYKELIDGYFYYKYSDLNGKNLTIKGVKRDKLKKIAINNVINRYIPQVYKIDDINEEIIEDKFNKFIKICIFDFIK